MEASVLMELLAASILVVTALLRKFWAPGSSNVDVYHMCITNSLLLGATLCLLFAEMGIEIPLKLIFDLGY